MKIKDIKVGQKAKLTGYADSNKEYRHKLLTMGLTRGAEFTVVRKAPFGDPVEIKLHGYNLSLRKDEAESMELELID